MEQLKATAARLAAEGLRLYAQNPVLFVSVSSVCLVAALAPLVCCRKRSHASRRRERDGGKTKPQPQQPAAQAKPKAQEPPKATAPAARPKQPAKEKPLVVPKIGGAESCLVDRIGAPPGGGVSCVAASPDGNKAAVANDTRSIRIFDTSAGLTAQNRFATVTVPMGRVTACALGDNGTLCVAVDQPSNLYFYHVGAPAEATKLEGEVERAHPSVMIRSVAYVPRNMFFTCDESTGVRLWSSTHAIPLASISTSQISNNMLAVSPEGELMAVATAMSELHVWKVCRVKGTSDFSALTRAFSLSGHELAITGVSLAMYNATSPRRFTAPVLVSCSLDKTVRIWKGVEGWDQGGTFDCIALRLGDAATHVALSPDGVCAAAVCTGAVWFISTVTGEVKCSARHGHSGFVSSVAWVGNKILLVGSSDRSVSVWRRPQL